MSTQRIILGDCLNVFANERNVPAFVSDPPANIGFMGRSWDKAHPAEDYAPILPPRDKAHLRELQREHAFVKYWATRYAMAYDIADQHAVNIVWTLPRTSYQTATALRVAGWNIKDNLVHLFGSGWMKSKRTNGDGERMPDALAPGQEGWILATKGRPELDIDACRVPRGERPSVLDGGRVGYGGGSEGYDYHPNERGSIPKNAVLSHCEGCGAECVDGCVVAEINTQSGNRPGMSGGGKHRADYAGGLFGGIDCDATTYADQGGAARFFNTFRYLSKCSPSERHAGCDNLYWKADKKDPFGFVQVTREEWERLEVTGEHLACLDTQARRERTGKAQGNVHPTVKSYRLMHWLHSLTGAKRILDLTAGSGTGMYTAFLDGIEWLGAEICPQAIVIAEARLAFWKGLSFDARRAFMEDDVVLEPITTKANQRSLFT